MEGIPFFRNDRAPRPINLATSLAVPGAPPGAIAMCALASFLGAILSGYAAAALLKRFCAPASEPRSPQPVALG